MNNDITIMLALSCGNSAMKNESRAGGKSVERFKSVVKRTFEGSIDPALILFLTKLADSISLSLCSPDQGRIVCVF